ncbi:MAG: hypothetical protein ACLP0J_06385 [Solirubrobacteraceae bacterium]
MSFATRSLVLPTFASHQPAGTRCARFSPTDAKQPSGALPAFAETGVALSVDELAVVVDDELAAAVLAFEAREDAPLAPLREAGEDARLPPPPLEDAGRGAPALALDVREPVVEVEDFEDCCTVEVCATGTVEVCATGTVLVCATETDDASDELDDVPLDAPQPHRAIATIATAAHAARRSARVPAF